MNSVGQIDLSASLFGIGKDGTPCDDNETEWNIETFSPTDTWSMRLNSMANNIIAQTGGRPNSAGLKRPSVNSNVKNSSPFSPKKPIRPMSARPRMTNQVTPYVNKTSPGKRKPPEVSQQIRNIYKNVGREFGYLSTKKGANHFAKRKVSDVTALREAIISLKTDLKGEQEKSVKAFARIRRLEEALLMKEKRIDEILKEKSTSCNSLSQRENARKHRQHRQLIVKLREKISQQAEVILAFETSLEKIRNSSKHARFIEIEKEKNESKKEVSRLMECLRRQEHLFDQNLHHQAALINQESLDSKEIKRLKLKVNALQQENVLLEGKNKAQQQTIKELQNNIAKNEKQRMSPPKQRKSPAKYVRSPIKVRDKRIKVRCKDDKEQTIALNQPNTNSSNENKSVRFCLDNSPQEFAGESNGDGITKEYGSDSDTIVKPCKDIEEIYTEKKLYVATDEVTCTQSSNISNVVNDDASHHDGITKEYGSDSDTIVKPCKDIEEIYTEKKLYVVTDKVTCTQSSNISNVLNDDASQHDAIVNSSDSAKEEPIANSFNTTPFLANGPQLDLRDNDSLSDSDSEASADSCDQKEDKIDEDCAKSTEDDIDEEFEELTLTDEENEKPNECKDPEIVEEGVIYGDDFSHD